MYSGYAKQFTFPCTGDEVNKIVGRDSSFEKSMQVSAFIELRISKISLLTFSVYFSSFLYKTS